jgi:tetratricopeptide (TPR) repeat protein
VDRVRAALAEQLAKARTYFDAGKQDFDAGNFVRAESALYLATKFDPKNEEFARLHQAARQKSGYVRARAYVEQAESEESYGRAKEALGLYKRAVDCDPPDATAFFRAGRLMLSLENDERSAVAMYRKATMKEPANAQYRVALAELYERNGLLANALREAQAALGSDPANATAKAMLKRLKK